MGNKTVQNILSILFIIFFGLGIAGYLNKDKVSPTPNNNTDNTNTNVPSNTITPLEYTGVENSIGSDILISGFVFTKQNKNFNSGYVGAKIDGNSIVFTIKKEGIATASEGDPAEFTYTINDITGPMAVQAEMSTEEGNKLHAYVLGSNNRMYFISFDADPRYHQGMNIQEYVVDGVEEFTIVNTPLTENPVDSLPFVLFKTTDGTFYTDYQFNAEGGHIITKITNSIEPVAPVDNVNATENTAQETTQQEQTAPVDSTTPQTNTTETNTNTEANTNTNANTTEPTTTTPDSTTPDAPVVNTNPEEGNN